MDDWDEAEFEAQLEIEAAMETEAERWSAPEAAPAEAPPAADAPDAPIEVPDGIPKSDWDALQGSCSPLPATAGGRAARRSSSTTTASGVPNPARRARSLPRCALRTASGSAIATAGRCTRLTIYA